MGEGQIQSREPRSPVAISESVGNAPRPRRHRWGSGQGGKFVTSKATRDAQNNAMFKGRRGWLNSRRPSPLDDEAAIPAKMHLIADWS
jgi:hypothetical protein